MNHESYIYIFIRNDLSKEQQIIQSAHAIYKTCLLVKSNDTTVPNIVLIDVSSEDELFEVREYLKRNGIKYEMFYEPDIRANTAIATYPLIGDTRTPLLSFDTMK